MLSFSGKQCLRGIGRLRFLSLQATPQTTNSPSWGHISTPATIVNRDVLEDNIRHMQNIANRNGVDLRPHVKTHKCVKIAQLQLEHGAVGVTCSRLAESLYFIRHGFDVLIAYPMLSVDGIFEVLKNAETHTSLDKVAFVVDSAAGVDALCTAINRFRQLFPSSHLEKIRVNVRIKVDVGLHRCGVKVGNDLLKLAEYIDNKKPEGIRLSGVLSHGGHAYAAQSQAECETIANEESMLMRRAASLVGADGFHISVGCTLTELSRTDFAGINEIRPGNYVFLDSTPVRLGLARRADISLSVLATVISVNDKYAIVDCGSKLLSSDLGAHGTGGSGHYGEVYPIEESQTPYSPISLLNSGYADCVVNKLSEEHGWISISESSMQFYLGQKVRIVPNHSCPVVNLSENLVVIDHLYQPVHVWELQPLRTFM